MKKRKLGNSGLEVSAIGLGCMGQMNDLHFGERTVPRGDELDHP